MRKLLLLSLIFLVSIKLNAQSIDVDHNAFGIILIDDSIYSGTGFVLSNPYTVVTCAHVIDSTRKLSFISFATEKPFELELIKYDIDLDVAVLKSKGPICRTPLLADTTYVIKPKQIIFYLGYDGLGEDKNNKQIKVNDTIVFAVGQVDSGNKIANFVEFFGFGVPGYSGGPVINASGKVIYLMREAWLKQGVKGGKIQLVNRAFSIKPVFDK